MVESRWCSLLREKLSMAKQLLRMADQNWHLNTAPANEGLIQGAVALLGEARRVLLMLVAETARLDDFEGDSLTELQFQAGNNPGEVQFLESLAQDSFSWWSRLDALLANQRRPGERAAAPQSEGLIAVSSEVGPERSVAALQRLIDEFIAYFEAFSERHDQW